MNGRKGREKQTMVESRIVREKKEEKNGQTGKEEKR